MRRLSCLPALAAGFVLGACSLLSDLSDIERKPDAGDPGRDAGSDVKARPTEDGGEGVLEDDAAADAGTEASAVRAPALVQSGVAHLEAVAVPASIAPTTEGNLLVVAVAIEFHARGRVASIADNAPGGSNTYVTADQKSIDAPCDLSSEIWFAKNVRPGATTVTVTMTQSVEIETWVLEFSGLSRTDPLDRGAVVNNGAATTTVTAPAVTPSTPRAVVVSTACSCETIASIHPSSPFINLPIQVGEATAFHVTDRIAPWGAVWTSSLGTFNASTVAFK